MQHQYLMETRLHHGLKSLIARLVLHYIRLWDVRTSVNVDRFIAISAFIARRIKKVYGRDSDIVYAPIEIDKFSVVSEKENFFLTASRMVPYKRIDIIVKAFAAMPDKRLVVIGDGPEFKRLKEIAGPNVTMLGFQGDAVLRDHMQRARAFIFAAHEDQGLIPIEAQACGTPVIAYRKGGASETVIGIDNKKNDLPTGLFFDAQTPESIVDAVGLFEIVEDQIKPEICRKNAERFSVENFSSKFSEVIDQAMNALFKDDRFEIKSEQHCS